MKLKLHVSKFFQPKWKYHFFVVLLLLFHFESSYAVCEKWLLKARRDALFLDDLTPEQDGWTTTEHLAENRRVIQASDFITSRGLNDYVRELGHSFFYHLEALGERDIWLDLGAGGGYAGVEYLNSDLPYYKRQKGNYFAIGYDHPQAQEELKPEYKDKFKSLSGRFFEEISDQELDQYWGQVSLISSRMGILSYVSTDDFSFELQRALRFLRQGGHLHMQTNDLNLTFKGKNGRPLSIYQSKSVTLRSFLEGIKGTQLIEFKSKGTILFVLKRIEGEIKVPRLKPIRFIADHPPKRDFYFPDFDVTLPRFYDNPDSITYIPLKSEE